MSATISAHGQKSLASPSAQSSRPADGLTRFKFHHSTEVVGRGTGKRNKPHRPAKVHARRSRDFLRNAEVAAIEVADPLALEPGEKIVTLRSIRNDPLARLHRH